METPSALGALGYYPSALLLLGPCELRASSPPKTARAILIWPYHAQETSCIDVKAGFPIIMPLLDELRGMKGLKDYLLANRQDQFARAMAHKMAAYALGRPLTFGDRAEVDRITAALRQRGDGLVDLVFLIVKSDLFQLK